MTSVRTSLGTISAAGLMLVAGCGGGGGGSNSANAESGPASQVNVGKTYPHWVPYLTEFYDINGELTSCIRGERSNDGVMISTTTSSPSTDKNKPVQCDDSDINTTFAEFNYNSARSEFSTQTESSFAPNVECQFVSLSTEGMATRIETYVSGSNNYTCSIDDGQLFTLQIITLEDELYETLIESYSNPGLDEVWETDDDILQARYVSSWTEDRLKKTTITYFGAGPDGHWNTSDDIVTGITEMNFKSDMIPNESYSLSPGLDSIPNTADDIVTGYTRFTYKNGNIEKHVAYSSAGLDGDWDSVDDNQVLYVVYY